MIVGADGNSNRYDESIQVACRKDFCSFRERKSFFALFRFVTKRKEERP